jgi:hypothetical protein
MQRQPITRCFLVLLAATLACSGSISSSSQLNPVGVYSATRFTTTANGVTIDQLAEGVTLTITLAANGTTMGALTVPAAGSVPLDLTGTWTRDGDVVTFHHATETFLDALPFRLIGDQLEAEGLVGPGVIRVTLSR